ncbi:MlaD family protein [Chitinophaga horti]|uniref:MlaD family protein n=1 Tax=Chitinophaga horti TaxID=2920382 RepID=A0ABY6J3Q6_9BACT|nr:MlaD family protein [Chitinophaga horti]UYQ94296.1 MlaD family protein [Chitinophaga horti]
MKISNETKVGILSAAGIALLVLGFNFLKGNSLFSSKKEIYAVYTQVNGLQPSNSVQVNGLIVGNVTDLKVMDKHAGRILVTLSISKDIEIPRNSVARISSELLGTKKVELDFGDATDYLGNGDTIYAAVDGSITDALKEQLNPLVSKLEGTLGQVDSLLMTVNSVFDTTAKSNLRSAINHLNGTMGHLSTATNSLTGMLDRNGSVNGTFKNLEAVTANLKANNEKIAGILDNADKTMGTLANGELEQTLKSLQEMSSSLNTTIAKLNTTDGTAGLLLNDKKVYNNLQSTLASLNKLLEDLRYNPKRYVHFSLFGKKDKVKAIPSDTAQ